MEYYFYILYSIIKDRYYIGHTNNLTERIRKHNSNHKGFTGKTGDWKLIYSEKYQSKADANNREIEVKKWKSRKMIVKLIGNAGSGHPD